MRPQRGGQWHVGAVAVVNALGDVRDASGQIIAGARAGDIGSRHAFLDTSRQLASGGAGIPPVAERPGAVPTNTTLCAVITDVPLGRLELTQLAAAAGAALFRRITPTGTSVDGDVVFALGPAAAAVPIGNLLMSIEALATAALERAIERAVRLARGRDGVPGLAD